MKLFPLDAARDECGDGSFLSDAETRGVVMSQILARADEADADGTFSMSSDDGAALLEWADETKFRAAVLAEVLDGRLLIDIAADGAVMVGMTPDMRAGCERIIKAAMAADGAAI